MREAQIKISDQGLKSQQLYLRLYGLFGHHLPFIQKPKLRSLIPMINLCCCMPVRPGNQPKQQHMGFRKSSTDVCETFWQDKVTNEGLWRRADQEPVETQIMRREWRWLGHILRRTPTATVRQTLR